MNKAWSNFPRRAFFYTFQGYVSAESILKQKLFKPVILYKAIPKTIYFGEHCFVINLSQSPAKDHIFVGLMCDVITYPYWLIDADW